MNDALAELRRTRRSRRLQDQEWFEIVYRVYLAALVGGTAVVLASDQVDDAVITAAGIDELRDRGPAVLGVVAVVAIAAGLRSGSNGGPIAIEAADVRHVLLAPIPRREVLERPVVQRLRTLAFAGGVIAAIAGGLASKRLPGSTSTWIWSAALAGACSVVLFGAVAVITHAARLPRPAATAIGAVLIAWQVAAVAGGALPGPGDAFGGLALWGIRRRPVELVAVVVTVLLVVTALAVCGRLRVDALTRRADLVSQLRFAVTMQDLRTVIVLRRQVRNEHPRRVPWWGVSRRPAAARGALPIASGDRSWVSRRSGAETASSGGGADPASPVGVAPRGPSRPLRAVHRRGWHSLARMPVARITRTLALSVLAGGAAVVTLRGTTPMVIGLGVSLFAMSLELLEPLSQEIDHPDRTDGLPVARDLVLAGHLIAPGLVVIPFALVGAGVVALLEPAAAAAAFALCIPIAWVGACGAVVSTVRDAPDPVARNAPWTPPEFAGFGTALRIIVPLAVSTIAAVPVLVLRESPDAGTVVRSGVALILVGAACVWWVARRQRWRTALRSFLDPASP
jgi:hypothetical protein